MTTSDVDDLTITRLCAEAMGITLHQHLSKGFGYFNDEGLQTWNPLHDDAQCMALVKRFRLDIEPEEDRWQVSSWKTDGSGRENYVYADDLNRAICLCVARMQSAKGKP